MDWLLLRVSALFGGVGVILGAFGAHALRATFEDGSNGLEAGVSQMLDRMRSRRPRVFSTLEPWFREFRLYHRKDGIIVKKADDLMAATRYGMMMRRFALSQAEAAVLRGDQLTPNTIAGFQVLDPVTGY